MVRPETDRAAAALAVRTGIAPALIELAIQAALMLIAGCQTPEAAQAFLRGDGLWWLPGLRERAVRRRKGQFTRAVMDALPADIVPAKRREVAEVAYEDVVKMQPTQLGAIMRENGR